MGGISKNWQQQGIYKGMEYVYVIGECCRIAQTHADLKLAEHREYQKRNHRDRRAEEASERIEEMVVKAVITYQKGCAMSTMAAEMHAGMDGSLGR